MKKSISILVLLAIVAFTVVSCKSHETCPAYSKSDKNSNIIVSNN